MSTPEIIIRLRDSNLPPVERVVNFVNEAAEVIVTLELVGLKRFLQLTSEYAYDFNNISPAISLADCISIMLEDKKKVETNNPIIGHYYQAMLFDFVQRSLSVIGGSQEDIDNMNPKILRSFQEFKECYDLWGVV
tara:strand:- start:321 stop:725 length:405 start_codon:yes stop_codon:yes gene_type:complete